MRQSRQYRNIQVEDFVRFLKPLFLRTYFYALYAFLVKGYCLDFFIYLVLTVCIKRFAAKSFFFLKKFPIEISFLRFLCIFFISENRTLYIQTKSSD